MYLKVLQVPAYLSPRGGRRAAGALLKPRSLPVKWYQKEHTEVVYVLPTGDCYQCYFTLVG